MRAEGGEDVDGVHAGFGRAIDDADFVPVFAVLPEMPMAIRVAYVEEVPLRVEAQLVRFSGEIAKMCCSLAGCEVKEAEAFPALADYC